jgi:hypothetical protein
LSSKSADDFDDLNNKIQEIKRQLDDKALKNDLEYELSKYSLRSEVIQMKDEISFYATNDKVNVIEGNLLLKFK